jgi:hypothetical protein
MGIVDFLQEWNLRKRVERAAKIYMNRNDPQGVSVMKPSPYRDRFQRKMEQIFDLDDPLGLFNDRGSASLRKNTYLGSVDGKPIIPNAVYHEISRDNNQHSDQGEGTIVNALHMSIPPPSPSPALSPSSSRIKSPSIPSTPSRQQSSSSQSQATSIYPFPHTSPSEDDFGLSSISQDKLTTVDINQ